MAHLVFQECNQYECVILLFCGEDRSSSVVN